MPRLSKREGDVLPIARPVRRSMADASAVGPPTELVQESSGGSNAQNGLAATSFDSATDLGEVVGPAG
jgi:hypothetical protein